MTQPTSVLNILGNRNSLKYLTFSITSIKRHKRHTCFQCRPGERKYGLTIMRDAPCSTHFPNASLIVGSTSSFILVKVHIQQDVTFCRPTRSIHQRIGSTWSVYIGMTFLVDTNILEWQYHTKLNIRQHYLSNGVNQQVKSQLCQY
jgi:hypothetical protein